MKRHIVIFQSHPFEVQADAVEIRQAEKHTGHYRQRKKQDIHHQNRRQQKQIKVKIMIGQLLFHFPTLLPFVTLSIKNGKV